MGIRGVRPGDARPPASPAMRQDDRQGRAAGRGPPASIGHLGCRKARQGASAPGRCVGRASGDHAFCRDGQGVEPGFRAPGRFRGRDNAGRKGLSHGSVSLLDTDRGQADAGAANTGAGRPLLKGGSAHAAVLPSMNLAWSKAVGKRRGAEIPGWASRIPRER